MTIDELIEKHKTFPTFKYHRVPKAWFREIIEIVVVELQFMEQNFATTMQCIATQIDLLKRQGENPTIEQIDAHLEMDRSNPLHTYVIYYVHLSGADSCDNIIYSVQDLPGFFEEIEFDHFSIGVIAEEHLRRLLRDTPPGIAEIVDAVEARRAARRERPGKSLS
jgi:hypothetical protein